MKQEIISRIEAMRAAMKEAGIFATIIPQADPHQSEYIAAHWQARRYFSGFTGSAGDLLITLDKALLWTDSRYFLQAADQLAGTGIELMKDGLAETPSMADWICDNVKAGNTVGINGLLFSHKAVSALRSKLEHHGITLVSDFDPIDTLWPDRPSLPTDPIFIHDVKYAGESASDKIARILENAARQEADSALISALDEIAWALNIRSRDVNCNPVATSYLFLSPAGSMLFILPEKVSDEVAAELAKAGVKVAPYDQIIKFLETLGGHKVLVDENRLTDRLWAAMKDYAVVGSSAVALPKAVKNETQIAGVRNAMERDGVALVKSIMEIERRLKAGERTTEIDVADILEANRSKGDLYFDLSFETIAGYGPHGAIVHYSATPETDAEIHPQGLLLIDSGAQYIDGTTDITRTIALGTPTDMERRDFTLVMKGHIALGTAIFPEGTRGAQLDVLARQFLWKAGLSYLHGTGHGVGHFLNVHEGPQSIRLNDMPATLTPGMITSNEPGVYREGIHGIRCENLVLTVPAFKTDFGKFLKFETLTLFPFDRNLFDLSIMTEPEIEWVDNYHSEVRSRLMPHLDAEQQAWLIDRTRPLRD